MSGVEPPRKRIPNPEATCGNCEYLHHASNRMGGEEFQWRCRRNTSYPFDRVDVLWPACAQHERDGVRDYWIEAQCEEATTDDPTPQAAM